MALFRRTYKKRRKKSSFKRKVSLFAYAIISIFITSIILVGISGYKFMNAPFSSAEYTDYADTETVWNEDETTIILILLEDINDPYSEIEKLALIHFDSTTNRYALFYVPVDVDVEYALNHGKGPLQRIYAVGNTDQDRGIYLLQKTILKTLAVRIDGYIITDTKGYSALTDVIGEPDPQDLSASLRLRNLPKIPNLISTFRESTITNLKIADILSIEAFIRSTSSTSSFVYGLSMYHLLDTDNWDTLWREQLSITEIERESVKVFIANASNDPKIPGLAGWGARVTKNMGADVLEEQNSFTDFSENTIITSDPELETVKRLAETLHIDNIINVSDLNQSGEYNPQIYRTKVSLMLVHF